jgi:hypothetical protein
MGTRAFWCEVSQNPTLALEFIAQRLNIMGCVNPTEQTSAIAAAVCLVAVHGEGAVVTTAVATKVFLDFKASHACNRAAIKHSRLLPQVWSVALCFHKACFAMRAAPLQARIKQLARAPHGPYIELLPPTPVQLLALYPSIAQRMFNRTDLPIECPLKNAAIQLMRAKIRVRGGIADGELANGGFTMQGAHANMTAWFLYFALLEACGYYRLQINTLLLVSMHMQC